MIIIKEMEFIRITYGRVLVFDTETNKMSVHLEGGVSSDGKNVLSNPDCVSAVNLAGTDYLIIHEDINGNDYGRVSAAAYKKNHWYNELYFLDLSIEKPTRGRRCIVCSNSNGSRIYRRAFYARWEVIVFEYSAPILWEWTTL